MVTSRASDDNLIDDQGARTSDIMAPPRQSRSKQPAKPAPAASDETASDGTAGGGVSPNGTPAAGRGEAPANGTATDKARPAVDDTLVDGVPALPADSIGSSRCRHPTRTRNNSRPRCALRQQTIRRYVSCMSRPSTRT